jgi:hypothetical protein
VDYEALTKKLSAGESKFCVVHFLYLFIVLFYFSFLICIFLHRKPCMMSKKTVWNTLVTWLRGWCSVRVWDDIIFDETITKEDQANHIEYNYHMYILLLGPPIDVFSRILEHHNLVLLVERVRTFWSKSRNQPPYLKVGMFVAASYL